MVSPAQWVKDTLRPLRTVRRKCLHAARPLVEGKAGLEIGGPSAVFQQNQPLPIYPLVGSLDNCDFSRATTWAAHSDAFRYSPTRPPGKNIFRDATDLAGIPDRSYDFILSSHNLEHFANPVRAIEEWKRVLRPRGAMVVVLPHHQHTFDHRRTPTSIDHIFEDFARNTGEDDLTHLPEILEKHDLQRDPGAGSAEEFHRRSLANFENRCLHHHVFDQANSRELLRRCGLEVTFADFARPFHILLLARLP
jgi:SAM-dependent methyltransferase